MGIKLLTSYIDGSESSYKWGKVRAEQLKGIVIDGRSFLYAFSKNEKISWTDGGRYWMLEKNLKEFFDSVKKIDDVIVVMDGFDHNRTDKKEQRIKNHSQKYETIAKTLLDKSPEKKDLLCPSLPVLSFKVFLMVMEKLGVPVHFAEGEGDPDTVAIANCYDYPVLASDSDYYMYDIKAGYIPFNRFNWRAPSIKAEVYKLCDFNSQFGLSLQLSRMIPAVLGNDLIESELLIDEPVPGKKIKSNLLKELKKEHVIKSCDVGSLVQLISEPRYRTVPLSCISTSLSKNKKVVEMLETNLEKAQKHYDDIKPMSKEELQAKSTDFQHSIGREKFLSLLMKHDEGRLLISATQTEPGSYLPSCVIDDPHKPTARLASVDIRQSMYTMMSPLMKEKRVIEIIRNRLRKGGNIKDIEMVDHEVILSPSPTLPSVLDIEAMSLDHEKLSVFCRVLGIDRNILDGFDEEWKLVIAAASYWVKKFRPKKKLIEALAATFVQCSRLRPDAAMPVTSQRVLDNLSDIPHAASMNALHNFACFQCIYIDTATLNDLLQGCLDDTLSPAFFFDGKFAHTYVCSTPTLSSIFEEKIKPDQLYKDIFATLLTQYQTQ